MVSPKIAAVRGMNDLLPAQAPLWEAFEGSAVRILQQYGYAQIRTPILESTALFRRGLGEVTDIVEKEMYSFVDSLNGEALTLRPENTAGVVRAAIEHSLLYEGPCRLWYLGPMFRHERPQLFGVRSIGDDHELAIDETVWSRRIGRARQWHRKRSLANIAFSHR